MALQLNYTNALNQNYPEAYARIHEFWGNGVQIRFEILFYENLTAYQNGDKEIDKLGLVYPYVDGIGISDIYNQLKTEPLFTNAIDV
jgi:hypothetical protein